MPGCGPISGTRPPNDSAWVSEAIPIHSTVIWTLLSITPDAMA